MVRLMLFGLVAVPIALVASAIAVVVFEGRRWRLAAALPLVAVTVYLAVVLVPDLVRDPTSHNLFPFEVGLYFSPAFPYMLILATVYYMRRHRIVRGAK